MQPRRIIPDADISTPYSGTPKLFRVDNTYGIIGKESVSNDYQNENENEEKLKVKVTVKAACNRRKEFSTFIGLNPNAHLR